MIPVLARPRVLDYLELTKPRITLLVLATTLVGFYLATEGRLQSGRCFTPSWVPDW